MDLWQLRLINLFLKRNEDTVLLSSEFLKPLIQQAEMVFDAVISNQNHNLMSFLSSSNASSLSHIESKEDLFNTAAVITYFDLPPNVLSQFTNVEQNELQSDRLRLLIELKRANIPMRTIQAIIQIIDSLIK